jgi:hypothetical protein
LDSPTGGAQLSVDLNAGRLFGSSQCVKNQWYEANVF